MLTRPLGGRVNGYYIRPKKGPRLLIIQRNNSENGLPAMQASYRQELAITSGYRTKGGRGVRRSDVRQGPLRGLRWASGGRLDALRYGGGRYTTRQSMVAPWWDYLSSYFGCSNKCFSRGPILKGKDSK